MPEEPQSGKRRPFSYYLLLSMVILTLVVATGVTIADYLSARENFYTNAAMMQRQTEEEITQTVQLVDSAYRLYDNTLNLDMEQSFDIFMAEYDKAGRDPARMNLTQVKSNLGGMMDIYVINQSMMIEYSTYAPELGLDFKQWPVTHAYLAGILNGSGFFPDRIVREVSTGQFRKYAYMPSPDHQYIFELGLVGDVFRERHGKLQFEQRIADAATLNPYVLNVRLFDTTRHQVNNFSYRPTAQEKAILGEIIEKRETIEVQDAIAGKTIKYLFINLTDPQYASDMSWIVEVTYDTALIQDQLNRLILFHGIVALAALCVSLLSAVVVARYLTRPFQQIVTDVDTVAKGDLTHKVSSSFSLEFASLEKSINAMVNTLTATIDRMQESEMKYRDLVGLLPQIVFEADTKGNVVFGNRAAFDTFGYSPDELAQGLTALQMVIPAQHERLKGNFQDSLAGIAFNGSEYTFLRKDRSTFEGLVYSAPILRGNDVLGLRGIVVDITRLKEVEGDLIRLNQELERRVLERTIELEAAIRELESFSYTVSHDLRAPLRAIDGFSSILLEHHKKDLATDAQQYLEKVRENAQNMARLIDDLLTFSRTSRHPLNIQTVSPRTLVEEALEELRFDHTGRKVQIVRGDLPDCRADPALLKQVFLNLISNALKFTRTRAEARIEIGSILRDTMVAYYVRDNGIGFDMRYANKLFQVFQRLHSSRAYEGTGVGLAIVKRIIDRHGGSIWVESQIDAGTTFYFTVGQGSSGGNGNP
ncbi:MAG: ATP-binding protein [Methanomicrobiales archaeon]|nr:ATP-binding protein [Methanomicrobiales archaeon]